MFRYFLVGLMFIHSFFGMETSDLSVSIKERVSFIYFTQLSKDLQNHILHIVDETSDDTPLTLIHIRLICKQWEGYVFYNPNCFKYSYINFFKHGLTHIYSSDADQENIKRSFFIASKIKRYFKIKNNQLIKDYFLQACSKLMANYPVICDVIPSIIGTITIKGVEILFTDILKQIEIFLCARNNAQIVHQVIDFSLFEYIKNCNTAQLYDYDTILVKMIVCLNKNNKQPVNEYFQDDINGKILFNLIIHNNVLFPQTYEIFKKMAKKG